MMNGWKMVHARHGVPAQNASVALPLIALEIAYFGQAKMLQINGFFSSLTSRTETRTVSDKIIRVIMISASC